MEKSFRWWLATWIVSALFLTPVMAGEGASFSISLRTAGEVPPDLVTRVAEWVSGNVAPVTQDGAIRVKGKTLDAIVKSVPAPPGKTLVLVLVNELAGETQHIARKAHVVAVNVGVMKLADMSTEAARETFSRRVEKEAVGALAAALGLPACPMIRCALYAAETTAELDEKSRGLCPPCMQKLEELLR